MLRLIHVIGALLAVGGVLTTDFLLFVVDLKPKFAVYMSKVAPVISTQIWIGLVVLGTSGVIIFQGRPWLTDNTFFMLKKAVIVLIIINGVFLNVYITPKFQSLASEWADKTDRVEKFRKIAMVSGILSFASWIGVIILSVLFI